MNSCLNPSVGRRREEGLDYLINRESFNLVNSGGASDQHGILVNLYLKNQNNLSLSLSLLFLKQVMFFYLSIEILLRV